MSGYSMSLEGETLEASDSEYEDDIARVQNLQAQRITSAWARIQSLSHEECQVLLEQCLNREPSLIFDLLDTCNATPVEPSHSQPLSWCVCGQMQRDAHISGEEMLWTRTSTLCVVDATHGLVHT
ncbi:uncharacterized protein LOC144014669 [Festucalex cinctus]